MSTTSYLKVCIVLVRFLSIIGNPISPESDEAEESNQLFQTEENENVARVKEYVRQARTEDGVIDLNKLIRKNIIDPSDIADFNVSSSSFLTDINGRFSNVNLYGLKGFSLNRVAVNLSQMELSAEMSVPALSVGGDYVLDGTLTFVQVSGDGQFWMNLTEVIITGNSLFHAKKDGGLEMGEVKLHCDVGDIQLNFENLMGGGTWSKFSNSILNQLSELILDELKHSLLSELGSFLRDQFNDNILHNVPPGFIDPNSESIIDEILKKAAEMMVENHLDPLPMPEFSKTYEHTMFFITTRGEVNLTGGALHGLTSLKRKGDVIASLENNSLVFQADFGFDNLTASYMWSADLFGIAPEGLLDIQVNFMEGFMKLKQDLREGSELTLDTFNVTTVGQIWLNIDGLGTWDYVMEVFANLITNGLKMQLADAITGPVKSSIQEQISARDLRIS